MNSGSLPARSSGSNLNSLVGSGPGRALITGPCRRPGAFAGFPTAAAPAAAAAAAALPPRGRGLAQTALAAAFLVGVAAASLAVQPAEVPRARSDAGAAPPSSGATVQEAEVVVLGAGFAGIFAALKLAREGAQVLLVDRDERFVFLPLLYEYALGDASRDEVAPPYADLLAGSSINFVQGEVLGFDPAAREVRLSGASVRYRRALVVALGNEATLPPELRGNDSVVPFLTLEDAEAMQARLADLVAKFPPNRPVGGPWTSWLQPSLRPVERNPHIVVVGGGYSGIELACNVAACLGGPTRCDVTLITRSGDILPRGEPFNRVVARDALRRAGVIVRSAEVQVVDGGVVVDGDPLSAELCCWTAGARPAAGTAVIGNALGEGALDERGCLRVSRTLSSSLGESVYAIGDNAAVDGMPLPTNAQVAMQQADVAAYNIWRAPQNDRKPASYVYFSLGEALSLGPTNASISSVGPVKVAGVLGTLARRGLYVVRQPTGRQRLRAAREAFRSLARVAVGGDSRAARLTRTSADAAGQSSQP